MLEGDDRKQRQADAVAREVMDGARVESSADYQAVLVEGGKVNHLLHFFGGVFTCGLWWIVWVFLALIGGEKRYRVRTDEYGNTLVEKGKDRSKSIVAAVIGGAILLVILMVVLSASASSTTGEPAATEEPTATPVPPPTPTPLPELTPAQSPLDMPLGELLADYENNEVLAHARFRYVENGQQPVTTSGFVGDVEQHYVEILPVQGARYSNGSDCYYADTREALHLRRDQAVTVTGRVNGLEFGDLVMFMCDVHEVELETNPALTRDETKSSVVRVHCESGGNWLLEEVSYGTGAIMDKDAGLILTAYHVAEGCETITVELPSGGERMAATLVKHCASHDQAYVRVGVEERSRLNDQAIYPASAQAREDQTIYAWVWGSEGLQWRSGMVTYSSSDSSRVDMLAVPGDSGSPIFNEFGHLLGTLSRSNASDVASYDHWNCEP